MYMYITVFQFHRERVFGSLQVLLNYGLVIYTICLYDMSTLIQYCLKLLKFHLDSRNNIISLYIPDEYETVINKNR